MKAGEVKGQLASQAVGLKDASVAKVHETLDELNAPLPIVREAGYTLSRVEIQISIPPKIVAQFSATDDVSETKVDELIEHTMVAIEWMKAGGRPE